MSDATAAQWPFSHALVHNTLFASIMALGASFVFFLVKHENMLPAYAGAMTATVMTVGPAAVALRFLRERVAAARKG